MAKDQFFELFVSDLEEIFFAESLLVNSIPKFIEKATDEKLREALKNQSEDIQQHIVRLNTIFDNLHETYNQSICQRFNPSTHLEDGAINLDYPQTINCKPFSPFRPCYSTKAPGRRAHDSHIAP